MTANVANFTLGSVAMTCLKRLELPVLVVTRNHAKAVERCMARESACGTVCVRRCLAHM